MYHRDGEKGFLRFMIIEDKLGRWEELVWCMSTACA